MNETECKYWSFDGGNSQRGICAIDNKFCDCLVGERDCYYKQLKRLEQKLEKIKEYVLNRMTGLACRHILNIIEGAGDE